MSLSNYERGQRPDGIEEPADTLAYTEQSEANARAVQERARERIERIERVLQESRTRTAYHRGVLVGVGLLPPDESY